MVPIIAKQRRILDKDLRISEWIEEFYFTVSDNIMRDYTYMTALGFLNLGPTPKEYICLDVEVLLGDWVGWKVADPARFIAMPEL